MQLGLIFKTSLIIFTFQVYAKEKGCPSQEAILPCRCLIRAKEYQIWCSHSSLSSVLESLKAIGKYITTPIDELILENNYLPSLPGRTFSPLKILRLMLRHNSLERVSTDWLADLESSLMELFIVEPKLSSLPQMSLTHLKNLKAVTIRSKLLKRLPLFSGLPLLKYIQIESNSLEYISPSNLKENPALEKFHLQFSPRLTRLEANLFDDLPKLDVINISYSGLNWVHPRAFSRLPNLKELALIGNKFTDPGMIGRSSRELSNLETIRLDYNYINVLEEATFVDMQSLKSIFLSNNLIGELRKGAFHRLPALKNLDLSKNRLQRVQHGTFYQPSFLEELNLQHNQLNDVLQLRTILEDLPKLVYLDVSFNKLDAIPFGSLMGHTTLEQFNLGYNRIRMVDKEAFIGMPALRDLVLTNNSLIDNNRVPFWNLPALKSLELSKNYLRKLDPRFLTKVGSLRRVDLSKNGLNIIDPEAFLSAPLLEHVNVSYNYIKIVHPVTFRHLTQLYELDVSRNSLKVLIPGLPRNIEHLHLRENEISKISFEDLQLPALRLLDLSENRIQTLGDSQFKSLERLRKLYFRSNFLRNLGERSLEGLIQLEILDLSDNRISEIHPLSLQSTSELKILDISDNQLSLIGSSLLANTKFLRKLNASHNQLGEILGASFQATLNLEDLDLSSNLLVQFPPTLFGLEKLKNLDLSSNRLKTINSTIIFSLKNLREVKLSKNFIQILEKNSFANLKHLKTVFLDENDVMLIEPNFMKMLPVLKLVKLQRNKIEELPSHTFNTLLSLQTLELQENSINSIYNHAFHLVPQLLTLNLSHNEIMKIEDAGLQSVRSLELLDLSFNKITKMSSSLSQLEWLVELRLKNNFICEVDEDVFGNMPRLKVLDLKNNKLISFPEIAVERLRENTAQLDVEDNPLACTCDILWLKSWLRESSQKSPRCADGTLLKEMPLSMDECPLDKQREKLFSGCDTELLNAPAFGNIELYSKYANLRNFSATFSNGKNHVAPSPEESEYFYDDYIDYPFNETSSVSKDYILDKLKDKTHTIVERVPLTEKQINKNQTGNTPVLYAAPSKTKQKPVIPAKVPDSPSTSGFTFFGIPLPALKNIFGKKDDGTIVPQQAERKNAIMSNPRKEKKQPLPKQGGTSPYIAITPELFQNPQQVPRPGPELQGGFLPILPGNGGFKPIADPRLTFTSTVSTIIEKRKVGSSVQHTENEEKKRVPSVAGNNFSLQSSNVDDIKPKEHSRPKKNYNLEMATNRSSLVISADATLVSNNEKRNDTMEEGNINITSLESVSSSRILNKSESHSFVKQYPSEDTLIVETTSIITIQSTTLTTTAEATYPPEPTTSTTTKKPELIYTSLSSEILNVSESVSTALGKTTEPYVSEEIQSPTNVLSAEDVKETELSGMETQIKESEEKLPVTTEITKHGMSSDYKPGSFLSTILIPGGQQPLFKPTSRSTITKVASPRGGNASPLHSSIEVAEPRIQNFHVRGSSQVPEELIITSTEENSEISSNWYFENYNKKNLKPFVSKNVENKHSRGNKGKGMLLIVLIGVFVVFS